MEKAEKIWINGEVVPWDDATVHLVSNTLHYGFGVFEGIRCYKTDTGPAVFRLREHMVRLARSAEILGFSLPYTLDELVEGTREVIRANGFEQCYIRPLAYVGEGGMGLSYEDCPVSVAIAVWFWGEYVGKGTLENGSRARVSTYARHHINTNMSKAKACGNYMLFQMARTEARRDGYDEALLLDSNGHVAEGSVEHIFLVRDGALVTPPLTHLLDGITRNTVIVLARELGLEVREELFSRDHVLTSDEAFFVGTGAEVTPLVELDRRPIGSGKPGPVTKQIQEAYFTTVYGRSNRHADWLTYV
ncbi:branched-chain amino acid transaminase [Microbaculum marinisediminis]|uniref:Branched-chain-amino-acid aminotransferase n=1 Tax=Microbaculum marinisediminis TaxID=2931392 RepID=A0AAW5R1G9_9HYPH|nr:branched-chain amino acid transaminase [Microbaculum sp. A6E488]MCT8974136.1 branched-chain amino acid transaminase [Microbaculum sp. A6E488]